jgi:hypothetical protein
MCKTQFVFLWAVECVSVVMHVSICFYYGLVCLVMLCDDFLSIEGYTQLKLTQNLRRSIVFLIVVLVVDKSTDSSDVFCRLLVFSQT